MTGETLKLFAESPADFRHSLNIDADGVSQPFRADPWQAADFAALDPGWQLVAGRIGARNTPKLRAYLERPRGHSKTSDLAMMVVWALVFSQRTISGVAAAADKDQAVLLRNAINRLVNLNPWLSRVLDVQQWRIKNKQTESELQIISSDAGSSYGLLTDFIVVDELTHWRNRDLWDSLFSTAAKRKNCLLLIISNAGLSEAGEAWQWQLREACRLDRSWYFSRLDGPKASWITPDRLAEQERLLPQAAFRRLWLNEWNEGSGDALSVDDIAAAINRDLQPMTGQEEDYVFFAGLDLSVSRDHSAFVVISKHVGHVETIPAPTKPLPKLQQAMVDCGLTAPPREDDPEYIQHPASHRYRLALCQSWKPQGGQIDLEAIEQAVLAAHKRFNLVTVGFDPFQAALMSQRLIRQNVSMTEITFTGMNLSLMASALLEEFKSRNIEIFDDPDLIRDLRRLRIVEKAYGFRLEASRDQNGHADRATGLCLALLAAKRTPVSIAQLIPGEIVCFP